VGIQLLSDSGTYKVTAVGIKTLGNHQIDATEIHIAQIYGYFFGFWRFLTSLPGLSEFPIFHPYGWYMDVLKVSSAILPSDSASLYSCASKCLITAEASILAFTLTAPPQFKLPCQTMRRYHRFNRKSNLALQY
jgi:hypothetical protein